MKVPLGVSAEGTLEIDIAAKGPHLLVAAPPAPARASC